jgi:transcriptional regulator EpsA
MPELVILSRLEEESLVRAIEAGLDVQRLRQFFMWCQGPLRALLPHGVMVCIQFGEQDQVLHVECLSNLVHPPALLASLCDPVNGLALRLSRHCRDIGDLACLIDGEQVGQVSPNFDTLRQAVALPALRNVLAQGSGRLPGGATFFALFGISGAPSSRHAFFLALLLPHLHMALLRVITSRDGTVAPPPLLAPLSEREIEVLGWVTRGKSNPEIGLILGLSALTVKNHLQRIYRKLNVHNRVQALARCHDLKLLVATTA